MRLPTVMELRKMELVQFIYKLENNMFKGWFERVIFATREKSRLKEFNYKS